MKQNRISLLIEDTTKGLMRQLEAICIIRGTRLAVRAVKNVLTNEEILDDLPPIATILEAAYLRINNPLEQELKV